MNHMKEVVLWQVITEFNAACCKAAFTCIVTQYITRFDITLRLYLFILMFLKVFITKRLHYSGCSNTSKGRAEGRQHQPFKTGAHWWRMDQRTCKSGSTVSYWRGWEKQKGSIMYRNFYHFSNLLPLSQSKGTFLGTQSGVLIKPKYMYLLFSKFMMKQWPDRAEVGKSARYSLPPFQRMLYGEKKPCLFYFCSLHTSLIRNFWYIDTSAGYLISINTCSFLFLRFLECFLEVY